MRLRYRHVFIFVLVLVTTTALSVLPAHGADNVLPSEMMAVIQTDFQGFNTNDFALSNSQYVSDVVIIDETPPYRWEGPGANTRYWADFRKFAKTIKLTSYHLSFQKPAYWEETNGRAYVVLPTIFTGVAGGKPFTETGVETYLLIKVGATWKTQGWAYGKTSMH